MAKSTTKPANGVKSKTAAQPKAEAKAALSQERVAESDIDDSSEEDSSDSEAKATTKSTPAKKGNGTVNISSDVEDSGDAESESDVSSTEPSSSSEDEDDEDDSVTKPTEPKPAAAASVAPQADTPQTDAPRTGFEAPFGYVKMEGLGGPVVIDLASLGSKDLWHIEVPAGVSLADLTKVSASAIKNQSAVLSHKGLEYAFTEPHQGLADIPEAIIHPDPVSKSYRSSTTKISRSLRLLPKLSRETQVDTIPGYTADPDAQRPDTNFEPTRTIRPDPKTLRMRYKPPGFGPGRPGRIGSDTSSDEDMPDRPTFLVPGGATPSSKKKRAAEPADDATPTKLTKEEREAKRARKAARAAKRASKNA